MKAKKPTETGFIQILVSANMKMTSTSNELCDIVVLGLSWCSIHHTMPLH